MTASLQSARQILQNKLLNITSNKSIKSKNCAASDFFFSEHVFTETFQNLMLKFKIWHTV